MASHLESCDLNSPFAFAKRSLKFRTCGGYAVAEDPVHAIGTIRNAMHMVAIHLPAGREKVVALTHLETALFWATAANFAGGAAAMSRLEKVGPNRYEERIA